jgi:hypothetical protein
MEVGTGDPLIPDPNDPAEQDKSMKERVLDKLRMENLNVEEKISR